MTCENESERQVQHIEMKARLNRLAAYRGWHRSSRDGRNNTYLAASLLVLGGVTLAT
jgi:hypothetical protein